MKTQTKPTGGHDVSKHVSSTPEKRKEEERGTPLPRLFKTKKGRRIYASCLIALIVRKRERRQLGRSRPRGIQALKGRKEKKLEFLLPD